jgi:hypothetical protein
LNRLLRIIFFLLISFFVPTTREVLFYYNNFPQVIDAEISYFLCLQKPFKIFSIVQAKTSDIPFVFLIFTRFVLFSFFATTIFFTQAISAIFIWLFYWLQLNLPNIMLFSYLSLIFI